MVKLVGIATERFYGSVVLGGGNVSGDCGLRKLQCYFQNTANALDNVQLGKGVIMTCDWSLFAKFFACFRTQLQLDFT